LILGFNACTEIGPEIAFGNGAESYDTTYVLPTVPTQEPRRVLIEEFTGASCTNCPAGHTTITNLESQYPDRIIAIAYHKHGTSLDEPAGEGPFFEDTTKGDFRRREANKIATEIYGD